MNTLKELEKLSLCYGGNKVNLSEVISEIKEDNDTLTSTYTLPDGVKSQTKPESLKNMVHTNGLILLKIPQLQKVKS